MAGGVITVEKARADVFFIAEDGKEVFPANYNIEVKFAKDFGGVVIEDAIEEAKKFAIGAFKNKFQQKIRGKSCNIVVKDVEVRYAIKYGFNKVRA